MTRRGVLALAGAAFGCARRPSPRHPARLTGQAADSYRVRFMTTKGPFTLQVTRAWAPLGADRFYHLVRSGFYDNAAFFRVRPGFVVQFGISAFPEVTKAWEKTEIPDDPVRQSNTRGRIAFATDGPNTRTTQVYVNLADNSRLDARGFSPFGEVIEGMDVVERMYAGYGEGAPRGVGPDQKKIEAGGRVFLEREYPRLDVIRRARLVRGA